MLNFTLRDSEIDFINVSCWGTEGFILNLNNELMIGSIVEIKTPQIRLKANADNYRPWTTSKYELLLNEQQGNCSISLLNTNSNLPFDADNLFSLPVRDHSDYYKLQDVIINGQAIDNQHINLLFAIKKVLNLI